MIYTKNPIIRIESLLKLLSISKAHLRHVLENKDSYYKLNPQTKKDGTSRDTYIVKSTLRRLLDNIKNTIFAHVNYPVYLHGSLPGRSPATNARAHTAAVSGVLMDIESFFPSITCKHVFYMFRFQFGFSKLVSRTLADIITYNNGLPQGSSVSSYVANLVLWDENKLCQSFKDKGYRYTRYVDDIAVSARTKLTKPELYEIKRAVDVFIKCNGFRVKRKKTQLCRTGANITITGLRPMPDGSIRVCKKYVVGVSDDIKDISLTGDSHDGMVRSIQGKIKYVRKYSKRESERLEKELNIALKRR